MRGLPLNPSPEFTAIVTAVRQVMKNQKLSHARLADELGVSAQTVKRILNGYGDCPLERLIEICRVLKISLADLMQLANEPGEKSFELSLEDEAFFASSPAHLTFLYRLLDGKSLADIAVGERISLASARRYLRDLEEMHLVERLTDDGYKVRVEGSHNFRRDGALWPFFRQRKRDHFHAFFDDVKNHGPMTTLTSTSTTMARATAVEFVAEVKEFAARFRRRAQRDGTLLPAKELIPVEWTLGIAAPLALLDPAPLTER